MIHDGMPYGRNQGQGQGHSREVDPQSPTGLIFATLDFIDSSMTKWQVCSRYGRAAPGMPSTVCRSVYFYCLSACRYECFSSDNKGSYVTLAVCVCMRCVCQQCCSESYGFILMNFSRLRAVGTVKTNF